MDYAMLIEYGAPIVLAILSVILALLKKKYSKLGDQIMTQLASMVTASKALAEVYPEIAELSVKLEKDYVDIKTIWDAGEFTGWAQLLGLVSDFTATYAEIQKLIKAKSTKTA